MFPFWSAFSDHCSPSPGGSGAYNGTLKDTCIITKCAILPQPEVILIESGIDQW